MVFHTWSRDFLLVILMVLERTCKNFVAKIGKVYEQFKYGNKFSEFYLQQIQMKKMIHCQPKWKYFAMLFKIHWIKSYS